MRAVVALLTGVIVFLSPLRAAAQMPVVAVQNTGTVAGSATNAAGDVLPNAAVQAREIATGLVTARTTTDGSGIFRFGGLRPGDYVIEIIDRRDRVVGTAMVSVAPGGVVSTVTLTAAGGAIGGAAGISTTALLITTAGAAAGVFAVIAVKSAASPSR